jgi:hypothetical protein
MTEGMLLYNKKILWYYSYEKTKLRKCNLLNKYFAYLPKFNKIISKNNFSSIHKVAAGPWVFAKSSYLWLSNHQEYLVLSVEEQALDKFTWTDLDFQIKYNMIDLKSSERIINWQKENLQ